MRVSTNSCAEPEYVARRVREFRKRLRIAQKQFDVFIFEIKMCFDLNGLRNEWVSAADVYSSTQTIKDWISFEEFAKFVRRWKSVETSILWQGGENILLIRSVHIPKRRHK